MIDADAVLSCLTTWGAIGMCTDENTRDFSFRKNKKRTKKFYDRFSKFSSSDCVHQTISNFKSADKRKRPKSDNEHHQMCARLNRISNNDAQFIRTRKHFHR